MTKEEARILAIECRRRLRNGEKWVDIYKDITEEQKKDEYHFIHAINVQEEGYSISDACDFAKKTAEKIGDVRTTIAYFLEIHEVSCRDEYLKSKMSAARMYFASKELGSEEKFAMILWDELVERKLVKIHGRELLPLLHCLNPVTLIEEMGVTHITSSSFEELEDQRVDKGVFLGDLLECGLLDKMNPSLLMKMFPGVYEDELFQENFHPDAFWTKRVMRYITGKDWARAWDELRRANHGIFHGTHRQDLHDPKYRGFFGATAKNVRDLIETLFWKMRNNGFELEKPQEGYESTRFAQSYSPRRLHQVAGFDVAYYIDNPGVRVLPDGDAYRRFEFSETGHIAFILGAHFRKEANRKKREKRERDL